MGKLFVNQYLSNPNADTVIIVAVQLHQTAQGLAYLHGEGIIHGDLHADNLLIDETGAVRLTDFGLSLIAEGTAYNYGSHHGGGALRWIAPELFDPEEFGLDNTRPTAKSDIYAFGCICVEVSTFFRILGWISYRQHSSTLGNFPSRTSITTRSPCELYRVRGLLGPLFRMVTLFPMPSGP